jgi:glycosyltransferase involved in cell wall biosynthesis
MLAVGLAAHDVSVTVLGPASAAKRFGLGELPGVRFAEVGFGDRPRPRDAQTVLRLRRLLGAGEGMGKGAVVHAHGLRAGALCALALTARPRGRRPALVVTVHNAPPEGGGLGALVYRLLERVVARAADLVLCVSADLERRMRGAGARHVQRAVVPAPAAGASPAAPPSAAVSPAGGPPAGVDSSASLRRPIVLAVGRLTEQKGLGTLVEAAATWGDMDPVPRVVIAGDGPLGPDLRAKAAALGVDAEFLGHRDDVPALLAACDVLVVPSHWEGQPLVLQEALRAGAAIIATRVGGIPDLASPQAAYLVPPGDARQLAAGVRAVLADRSLAARLRAAALRRAAELPTEADAITAALTAYATAATRVRSRRVTGDTGACR